MGLQRPSYVPRKEADLVSLALIALLVLEIVNCIATFSRWQLSKEVIVVAGLACLSHNNLSVVRRESVNDVLDLLAQLQRLKLLQAFLTDLYTRRL